MTNISGIELTQGIQQRTATKFGSALMGNATHNGGQEIEHFPITGRSFNHGQTVSFLVSACQAIGMTEGTVKFGDTYRKVKIDLDKSCTNLIGILCYRPVNENYFYRLALSLQKLDDTSRNQKDQHLDIDK